MPAPTPPEDAGAAFERLLSQVGDSFPDDDRSGLEAAFAAVMAHPDAVAPPGIDAAVAVSAAANLASMKLDPPALTAAVLAPITLRPGALDEALFAAQSDEVRDLVDGVRRLGLTRWDRLEEEAAESLRKMFLAMARDVRVVLVVLAIRVEVIRRLDRLDVDAEERRALARETLDVFAPLANRLGIWQVKWELEDGAFRVLEPERYGELHEALHESREARDAFVERVKGMLRDKLGEAGIEAQVKGRAKHVYSIFKKMQRKDLSFEELFDVVAVRVICRELTDCYAALGIVHSTWVPIPSEFDDYVARPKENGYQSLHTAVMGPGGQPFEVQLRTRQMHEFAEFGVAAHWAYKEKKSVDQKDRFMVLRQLMDWEREVTDPHQFVESLKTDIFDDQVYVFTPTGDVVDLPQGSTPLDFAYRIHTMVGHRCRGAKLNGSIVTLETALKTGDRVEILTQKQPHPSRDWMNPSLKYLRTSSARQKVRQWFRQQDRDTAVTQGRELCDKELGRLDLEHATLEGIAEWLKYRGSEELFAAVGYGDRSAQSVATAALQVERHLAPPPETPVPASAPVSRRRGGASGLRLHDIEDVEGRRAKCCNPVPGDDVVGFVTRGRGIVVHRRTCGNMVHSAEPERILEVDWGPQIDERHAVELLIDANDRSGLLRDLSNLVSHDGINMTAAKASSTREGAAQLRLSLEFASSDQVARTMQRIGAHPDVLDVRRVRR